MASRRAGLSDEDRVLWAKVALSARPLKSTVPVAEDKPEQPTLEEFLAAALGEPAPAAPSPTPVQKPRDATHPFDRPTREKLAKGRLSIGGTVDLHGMTQAQAHGLLLSFLQRAHGGGLRYVLVITGKGASFGSDGALKRAVPAWLSTPPFRALVSSYDDAARNHGGTGALYLRLRRSKPDRPA